MTRKLSSNTEGRVLIPAPMLTMLHLIMVILLRGVLPLSLPAWAQWLGLALAAVGFVLGLLALLEFRRIRAMPDPKGRASGLVTTAIYRYTRNPVYLGFVCMLMGLGLSMGTYWGIVLSWPLMVTLKNFVIQPEEAVLEKRFGKQFLDYKSKVRRWL